MKNYKNKVEHFINLLEPGEGKNGELFNLFNIYSQDRFNGYLASKIEFEITGDVTDAEEKMLQKIKSEIKQLQKQFSDAKAERLEFDLAKIFHSNLREIGFGRFHVDDIGMWRWMSMNYFKEETFWRRGLSDLDKKEIPKAAKATFEHCIGKRSRDIFPRRYFVIGQRLFDTNEKYALIEKLAEKSRAARSGGFGNLIANIVETKLISPNDYVSKVISKIMFADRGIGDDKEVKNAFVRYNAYRKRLLNNASENVFRNEICLME